jgi:regulator of extracellular matrix RemA (YlzA/DUF370 family)
MFIHIGNRRVVSDKQIVGIFNVESLVLSDENNYYCKTLSETDRTVVVDIGNRVLTSGVSPFTVIKRTGIDSESFWRKE